MEGDRTVADGDRREDNVQQDTSGQIAADTPEPCYLERFVDRREDDVQQDTSGQIAVDTAEPCYLERFVDRQEQTIVIDSRNGCQVFRRLVCPVFHKGHTGNIPEDVGTNQLTYATILKSSSEGSTADLISEQGLRTSPESSSITEALLGTPVDEEREICKNNGRDKIFTDTRQNTLDQEEFDMGSMLPAHIHYRDKGTCTILNTKSGDQIDVISWALDSPTTAHFAEVTQPILSNVDELPEYLPSCNNTNIVNRLERSFDMDGDGRKNQVSLRLLERRKTIEVDKNDLSGLEVRHTSNLSFNISSQEQQRHHSMKSEVNIVWGKTIDADEVYGKERLFISELRLSPYLDRSLDDCTDYFSADMSSDTIVTSDYTDSFVETGDSVYASDCNDSFLEQTDIYPDNTDTKSDLTQWKDEEFANNGHHRYTPRLVSTLYTDLTHAYDIESHDKMYEKQLEIVLVDDVIEHPFDRKLLYKVSDTIANLGRGASDVETAAQGMCNNGDGVDQTDISHHPDQDICLPILHDQVSNRPHSRDGIHDCNAMDGKIQKSEQVVSVGIVGQSQEDTRTIQFAVNPKVGLHVSKDLPDLQLPDSRIKQINVGADDSWNNTSDEVETADSSVGNPMRQSQEDLPSMQLEENAMLTVSSMKEAASSNLVGINNVLLPQNSSDANVHCLLDGNSEMSNETLNIYEPVTVCNDAVCSTDFVKSVTTNNMVADYNNIAELSLLTPDSTPGNQGNMNTNTDNQMPFMTQEKSSWCTDRAVDDASSAIHLKMAGISPECMNASDAEHKTCTSQPLAVICDANISVAKYIVEDKPAGDETVMKCVERTEMFLHNSDSTTCQRRVHISKAVSTTVPYSGATDSQKINEPKSGMCLPLSGDRLRGRAEAADSLDDNDDGFVLVTSRRNRKLQKKSKKIQPKDATIIARDSCDGPQFKDSHNSNMVHHEYLPCQIVETASSNSVLDKTDVFETPSSNSVLDKTDIVETASSNSVLDKIDVVQTPSSNSVLDKTDIVETASSNSVLDKIDVVQTPSSNSVLDKTDIVETASSNSVLDTIDVVQTPSSNYVLDKTDIVETPSSSSLLDKTDIIEAASSNSLLDKTDIVEAASSNSLLDKTDIVETPSSSSLLDKTDIVEAASSNSLLDKTDIAEAPSSNSLLDKTDIVEVPSSSSLLVHVVNEKDETLTRSPISAQNSQDDKVMEKLASVSVFSQSEPVHSHLHYVHMSCIHIACATADPAINELPLLEQTLSAEEVQCQDNNREQSTSDLTMTEIMFEPETTVKPFVFSHEISNHGVRDTTGETAGEEEPFEPTAEDCSSEEFICRMLEGIDAHTQEYGEEFLHSDECGGMLLNIYTGGHRRILKPHRRFTKPDHETTSRSGDNDSDFTDPVTELEEDQKSAEESTVAISDLNTPTGGTLVNPGITKEGRRRGKGHKRKREGINKVEAPRPNSECSELNMSDDSGSIDASLEDLEHFGNDFSVPLSDEDVEPDSENCVSLFDQHDNVSDGVNVVHQHLDSHVDEISAEIKDTDHRHNNSVSAAADSDTKGWQTYGDSDTLIGHISVNESDEAECKSTTDRVTNSTDRTSSDTKVCSSAHHKSELHGFKESSDTSSKDTEPRAREMNSVGNNDSEGKTQESSVPIKETNDANVSCIPYSAEVTLDAVQISLQNVELHQRLMAQDMLGRDAEASLGITESCEKQGTMSNQRLRQENAVDRCEAFTNARAAVKVTWTKQAHTERDQLANNRQEVETAVNGPVLSFGNIEEHDDLYCQSETGNPYFSNENVLKYTGVASLTADLCRDSILTNTTKSGGMIEREKAPLTFNECVSVNTALESDVSNNEDDVVDLLGISARIGTLLDDSEERAHGYVDETVLENTDMGDSIDSRTEDVSVTFDEQVATVQLTIADHEARQGGYANVTVDIGDEHLQCRPDTSDTKSHCKETGDTAAHTTCTRFDHAQTVTQADHAHTTAEGTGDVQLKFSSEQEIVHLSDVIKESGDNNADYGNDNIVEIMRLKIGDVKWENCEKQEQRDDPTDGIQVTEQSKIYYVEGVAEKSDCEEQRRREDPTDETNSCRKTSAPDRERVFIGNNQNWRAADMGNIQWNNDQENGRGSQDRADNIPDTSDQSVVIENRDIQIQNMNWRVEDMFDVKWDSDEEDGSSRNLAEKIQERKSKVENTCEHVEIGHDQSGLEYIGGREREYDDDDDQPGVYLSDTEMRDLASQQVRGTHVADHMKVIPAGDIERTVEATDNVEWTYNNYNKNVYLPDLVKENLDNLAHKNENIKANAEWIVADIDHVKWDHEKERRRYDPKIEKSEDAAELTAEWRFEDINSGKWESDDEDQLHSGHLTDRARESRKMSSACREEYLIGDNQHCRVKEIDSVKWLGDERRREDLKDGIQEINDVDVVLRKNKSITDTVGLRLDDIATVKWQSDDEEDNVRNGILDRIQESTRIGGDGKTEDSVADNVGWTVEDIGHVKWKCDDEQQDDMEDVTGGTTDCSNINAVDRHEQFIGDHVQWRIEDIGHVKWISHEEKDGQRDDVAERKQECRDARAVCRSDSLSDTLEWKVEDFGDVKWESDEDDNDLLRTAISDRIQESIGMAADGRANENVTDNAEWRVEDIGDVRWESDEEDAVPREDMADRNKVLSDMKTVCRKYDFIGEHVEGTVEDTSDVKLESDDTIDGEQLHDLTVKLQTIHSSPLDSKIEESIEGKPEGFDDMKWESIDLKEKCRKDLANRAQESSDQSAMHETIDMQTHINHWRIEGIGNVKYENNEEKVRHNYSVAVVHDSGDTAAVARMENYVAADEESNVEDSGAVTLNSKHEETAKRSNILDICHQKVCISADGSMENKVTDTVERRVEDIGDIKRESDKEEDGRQDPIDRVQEMNIEIAAHIFGEMRIDNNHWRAEGFDDEQWQIDDNNVDQSHDLEYRLQENNEENVVNRREDIQSGDMHTKFEDNVDIKWIRDYEDKGRKSSCVDGINETRNTSPIVRVEDQNEINNEEWRVGDASGVIWGDNNKEDGNRRKYQADGILLNRDAMNVYRQDTVDVDNMAWRITGDDDMKLQSHVETREPREDILDRDQENDGGMENTISDSTGWRIEDIADVKWDSDDEVEEPKEDLVDGSKEIRNIRSSGRIEDSLGGDVEYRAEDTADRHRSDDTDEGRRCDIFHRSQETIDEDVVSKLRDFRADTIKWRVKNINNDKDKRDGEDEKREDATDTIQDSKRSSVANKVDWRVEDIEDVKWESDEEQRDYLADVTQETSDKSLVGAIGEMQTENNQWAVEGVNDITRKCDGESVERRDHQAGRTHEVSHIGAVVTPAHFIGDNVAWRVEDIGDVNWESDDEDDVVKDNLIDRSEQSSTDTMGYFTADNAAFKTFNNAKWQNQSHNTESTDDPENQINENIIEVTIDKKKGVKVFDLKLKTPEDVDAKNCLGRSGGNRKLKGQNTAASVIASHSVHSTRHEDVRSQHDVNGNEQIQASGTESADNINYTPQPVVCFTEAITHSPESRSYHDVINSHLEFTDFNRPANRQTSANVDSAPQTSDISHSAECLVNTTREHSSITGACSCVNASVLLTDVKLKTTLSESKQNRKKKHKKKNKKKYEKQNVDAHALEQAVNVKEAFGERCAVSEVMGVAAAADKLNVDCSPDDSARGESLRGLTAVLVVGSQADKCSGNTAAGPDNSVKCIDVCPGCEHTSNLEMLSQCDVEKNDTESKTENAGELTISCNDITKADPGQLSGHDPVKRLEQATTNKVSVDNSGDLLRVSTTSSLQSGCFSELDNEIKIDNDLNMYSRGDNKPTAQPVCSRSFFDQTLLERYASVSIFSRLANQPCVHVDWHRRRQTTYSKTAQNMTYLGGASGLEKQQWKINSMDH